MAARFSFIFALLLLIAAPALAWDSYIGRNMDAEVEAVPDGNTLVVKAGNGQSMTINFYGIGLPTPRQPYGPQARAYLAEMLPVGRKVTLMTINETDDGAINALVQVADQSINTRLITDGLAWVNRHTCKAFFCRRMHIAENTARQARRGLWSLNIPTPPWQWGEPARSDTSQGLQNDR